MSRQDVVALPPTDPVAYEAWLEESLTEADAAKFLGATKRSLQRARCTPGAGPAFILVTPRQIVYVRRDLIEFRDSRRKGSTADYRRRGQEAEESASSPEGDGGGE